MVIQATLDKKLPTVSRRPVNRERDQLIRLGHVFVFIEETSGIKRWTDGVPWSASRILGRFLVYRQLDTTSVRQKNSKRKNSRTITTHAADEPPLQTSALRTRNLPIDDYALVKKTLSLSIDADSKAQTIHLISYFSAHDVLSGKLIRPSQGGLEQVNILAKLTKSVAALTLGGKMPVGDESQYFLDSSYQLLDMLVVPSTNSGIDALALDPMGHSSTHMQPGETLSLPPQDAALQHMHYLQVSSGMRLHNTNSIPSQPLVEYPPPQVFPHIHQGLPLQILSTQDGYKLQMSQQLHHMGPPPPPPPVSYQMHLQVPPNMMTDMHPHMQQMFTQHNIEDLHGSTFPIVQSGSETSSMPLNINTSNVQQNPQFMTGPAFYPWGIQQFQPGESFPPEQYPYRESKEY